MCVCIPVADVPTRCEEPLLDSEKGILFCTVDRLDRYRFRPWMPSAQQRPLQRIVTDFQTG